MRLKEVKIHKYKSIETDQTFSIEDNTTVLVGMNESGKTSILEAIAKTHYFQNDSKFTFDATHDFPRREKKAMDKSGEDAKAVTCVFDIGDDVLAHIAEDVGPNVFNDRTVAVTTSYSNRRAWTAVAVDRSAFLSFKLEQLGIGSNTLIERLMQVANLADFEKVVSQYKDETYIETLGKLKKYFQNAGKWNTDCLGEYIAREHLAPALPKFLYYDEYYALPSRISIEALQDEELSEDEMKTAKALFDLADIDVEEIIQSESYENFKAELEATQAIITDELFKYWKTNQNLEIGFEIDKEEKVASRNVPSPDGTGTVTVEDVKIVNHILDIRVRNTRSRVSLPLRNRSKGFNWFFSFLVWFKKIQEDNKNNYILLLDEPGLNLHATAQEDLLNFLRDLSSNYQVLYTTHSPFMIDSGELHKVRTVVETDAGTVISDSIQEKDPNTLFPLQAALGYDIAQNLFVSRYNLLVEGPADLIYLTAISNVLETSGRHFLNPNITVVPVGGLDKVATFISLLRGQKLNVACLLDTFADQKGRQRVEDLVRLQIIKEKNIRFFDEFTPTKSPADIEDIFAPDDYLKLFNEAFESDGIKVELSDLREGETRITRRIAKAIGKDGFNHYRPANRLSQLGVDSSYFSKETLERFENIFLEMNQLFGFSAKAVAKAR